MNPVEARRNYSKSDRLIRRCYSSCGSGKEIKIFLKHFCTTQDSFRLVRSWSQLVDEHFKNTFRHLTVGFFSESKPPKEIEIFIYQLYFFSSLSGLGKQYFLLVRALTPDWTTSFSKKLTSTKILWLGLLKIHIVILTWRWSLAWSGRWSKSVASPIFLRQTRIVTWIFGIFFIG